jgi:hypothetical protein
MLLPWLAGLLLTGFVWMHLPLLLAWLTIWPATTPCCSRSTWRTPPVVCATVAGAPPGAFAGTVLHVKAMIRLG